MPKSLKVCSTLLTALFTWLAVFTRVPRLGICDKFTDAIMLVLGIAVDKAVLYADWTNLDAFDISPATLPIVPKELTAPLMLLRTPVTLLSGEPWTDRVDNKLDVLGTAVVILLKGAKEPLSTPKEAVEKWMNKVFQESKDYLVHI